MGQRLRTSEAEREDTHYFYYLLLLTVGGVLFFAFIFLRKMDSPFKNNLTIEMRRLADGKKMEDFQREIHPYLVRTFDKLVKQPVAEIKALTEDDIRNDIDYIDNIAADKNLNDIRKLDYSQTAAFLNMYFNDKKIAAKKQENIARYDQLCSACNTRFKDKQQQLDRKKAAINARSSNN